MAGQTRLPRQKSAYIMFVGEPSVGKTFYTYYLARGQRPEGLDRPPATIGIQFEIFSQRAGDDNVDVRFTLVDTAGHAAFKHSLPNTYRRAEAIVLMYDVTRRDTFDALRTRWWPEVQAYARNAVVSVLIGNKADLTSGERAVSRQEAALFAQEIGAIGFYERSALTDCLVDIYGPIETCAIRLCDLGALGTCGTPSTVDLNARKEDAKECCVLL